MKYAIAITTIVVILIAGFALNNYLSNKALQNSQHQWCSALSILTEHPIPRPNNPSKNPSRENSYLFYLSLKNLETHFHC